MQAKRIDADGEPQHDLVQQYMGRQLHLGGRPFYLRLWALLTGLLPLRLYLFRGGVLIFGDADEAAARDAEVRGQTPKGHTSCLKQSRAAAGTREL